MTSGSDKHNNSNNEGGQGVHGSVIAKLLGSHFRD
jgi:hypothetical protein